MESKGIKRKAYSVNEKLTVIERVRNGESRSKVCSELKLAESTLRGWLKDEQKFRDYLHEVDSDDGFKWKRARTESDTELDDAVNTWFTQQCEQSVQISGTILKVTAEKMAKTMDTESDFMASHGWLWRFQRRHGIKQNSLSGEIRSANQVAASSYPNQLQEILTRDGYTDDQVYNCDEADGPSNGQVMLSTTQSNQNVEDSTMLNITCSADCYPPCSFTWTGPQDFSQSGAQLSRFVDRNKGGNYICTASNKENSMKSAMASVTVIVMYGPGDSVNLGSNPPTTVNLHQRAKDISCNATCNPPCDYRWYHNRTLYSSGATLSLGVVENKTSGGNYTCEAYNKVLGLDRSSSTSINISVYYGAEIVSLSVQDSNTVNENSSAIFQCQIDSNPLPVVIWKKEGNNTVLKTESGVLQSQYRIESAQCQDTDNYTCSAYNQIWTQANRTLQFFVKCHPRTDSEVPLETKVYKNLHEAAFLRYTVISYPLPKFTWMFLGNGSESRGLPGSARPYVNGRQSELRFTSLNIDDFGYYSVMADNSLLPSAREVFEIIPADVPEVPSNITIMEVTINSVIVQWVAGYNGGTKQTFHILASACGLTRYVTASDPGYRNKGIVDIKDLASSTNYSISMSASNSIGTSNMTEAIFVITLEESACPSSLEDGASNGIGVGGAVGIGLGGVVLGFIAAIIAFTIRRQLNGPENSCIRSKGKTDDEMHTYSNTEMNPQTIKPIYEKLNKVNTEQSVYDKISPL